MESKALERYIGRIVSIMLYKSDDYLVNGKIKVIHDDVVEIEQNKEMMECLMINCNDIQRVIVINEEKAEQWLKKKEVEY